MKRIYLIASLLALTASRSYATTIDGSTFNTLSVLSASGIGTTLVSAAEVGSLATGAGIAVAVGAGIVYYAQTGENPVYAAASSVASAADAVFVPAYQSFKATFVSPESYPASAAQYVGKSGSIGATLGSIYNEIKDKASTYPLIGAIFTNNQSEADVGIGSGGVGTVWTFNDVNYKITGPWTCGYLNGNPAYDTYLGYSGGKYFYGRSGNLKKCDTKSNGSPMCMASYTTTADPKTVEPLPGAFNYPSIKDQIIAANKDAAFADEIRKAISNVPTAEKIPSSTTAPTALPAPAASPITNTDISNFFTANTTNVYNKYLETAASGGDATTGQAAAELAKAQAEEAQKDNEETFSKISDSPFSNSYNPGQFDIPTRFTTFLQNVKTSGLFSFSSSFFNSLPGGGSPQLTIDGGQTFGSHTFDFSQSLGGGLAILKSVLLALFGFLSVRAVIMKR